MATERQIAANRRNAHKSTGPRSRAGKRRASRNSYRHGLAAGVAPTAEFAKRAEILARKIAGKGADAATLELARSAAQAEFDLAQIRRARVALIERMAQFAEFEVPDPLGTVHRIKRVLNLIDRGLPGDLTVPAPPEMPSLEPQRSAEAVRRALPQLLTLDRYERRAAARRDRAIHQIMTRRILATLL
jgi:hypothetical protein